MLIDHMSEGLSFESFASTIGVYRDILYKWAEDYQDFYEAQKEGKDLSLLFWEKLGRSAIAGKVAGFNAATYIFTMKNKFGWRDKQELDLQTPREGFTLNYKSIKDDTEE